MIASIVLACMLGLFCSFLALVRQRTASLEGGVYHAPLDSAEAWSDSLDVDLGTEGYTYDMLPLPGVWDGAPATMGLAPTMVQPCPTYTLRTLAHICMCS